jgi:hypothetical protein
VCARCVQCTVQCSAQCSVQRVCTAGQNHGLNTYFRPFSRLVWPFLLPRCGFDSPPCIASMCLGRFWLNLNGSHWESSARRRFPGVLAGVHVRVCTLHTLCSHTHHGVRACVTTGFLFARFVRVKTVKKEKRGKGARTRPRGGDTKSHSHSCPVRAPFPLVVILSRPPPPHPHTLERCAHTDTHTHTHTHRTRTHAAHMGAYTHTATHLLIIIRATTPRRLYVS